MVRQPLGRSESSIGADEILPILRYIQDLENLRRLSSNQRNLEAGIHSDLHPIGKPLCYVSGGNHFLVGEEALVDANLFNINQIH
jgi:hypothetical protein